MIRMIAACDRNRVMGREGTLPWDIAEDWRHFLETTSGDVLLMGRRCYDDFVEYAPGRKVVVLSQNHQGSFPHARRAYDLESGLQLARSLGPDIWICGGAGIYRSCMELAEELRLTLIDHEFEGDVRFPEWEKHFPVLLNRRDSVCDGHSLAFLTLGKKPAG